MGYAENKAKAAYRNTEPSLTDQSQAHECDMNVIVTKFLRNGTLPQRQGTPITEDLSQLPTDFREMLELTRQISKLHQDLPPQLAGIPIDQLRTLTTAQLTAILTPPAAPPAKEEPK